jgi:genome maintenance exonuclease 1
MYQDWLFKDHPSGWRLRYRRNGGGYEASRDGENWQPVPSVTQITGLLNKNLHEWAVRQVVEYLKGELVPGLVLTEEEARRVLDGAAQAHRKAAQRAAGRGGSFHAWAEAYLKGEAPPPPGEEPQRSMALALAEWWEGNGGRLVRSEEALFHPEHLYAGRVDLVAHFGGRLVVVDLKTSSRPYPEHFLQVGAYALALREEGLPVEGGLVLCLGEGLRPTEVSVWEAAEAFLGLRRAWDFLQGFSL